MADVLSADERTLIDDAVERGKVTKVPTGESGYPGYIYDKHKGRVVAVEKPSAAVGVWTAAKRNGEKARQLRLKILAMLNEGRSVDEISDSVRAKKSTVKKHILILRREGRYTPPEDTSKHDEYVERVANVDALVKAGAASLSTIGELLRSNVKTIRRAMEATGRDFEEFKRELQKMREDGMAKLPPEDIARNLLEEGYGVEDVFIKTGLQKKVIKAMQDEIYRLRKKEKAPADKLGQ